MLSLQGKSADLLPKETLEPGTVATRYQFQLSGRLDGGCRRTACASPFWTTEQFSKNLSQNKTFLKGRGCSLIASPRKKSPHREIASAHNEDPFSKDYCWYEWSPGLGTKKGCKIGNPWWKFRPSV